MAEADVRGLMLRGCDGANLLGFLAAVGALRTLAIAESGVDWRLKWMFCDGSWTPNLSGSTGLCEAELVESLHAALMGDDHPVGRFPFNNLTVTPDEFKKVALDAQLGVSPHDRHFADLVVSFGSDAVSTRDGKKMLDTDLRTMSGVGHQHFIGTMKKLTDKKHATADDLWRSLFEPWDYADRKLGMRWDPEEDRRYALRWDNPSSAGGVPTMRGANCLAVAAVPLLPTAASARGLHTTGVSRRDGAVLLTWPIWEDPLSVDVVRSVVALRELQDPDPERTALYARGIVEIYRCQRIANGRYRNFTHAVSA